MAPKAVENIRTGTGIGERGFADS